MGFGRVQACHTVLAPGAKGEGGVGEGQDLGTSAWSGWPRGGGGGEAGGRG